MLTFRKVWSNNLRAGCRTGLPGVTYSSVRYSKQWLGLAADRIVTLRYLAGRH